LRRDEDGHPCVVAALAERRLVLGGQVGLKSELIFLVARVRDDERELDCLSGLRGERRASERELKVGNLSNRYAEASTLLRVARGRGAGDGRRSLYGTDGSGRRRDGGRGIGSIHVRG